MKTLHMQDAEAQGYVIDTCCNPPIGYKGPRFQPTALVHCYTKLESKLMAENEALKAQLAKGTVQA
jgi:hypothetical protein